MKGLILKDLLILKNQLKNLLFILVFFVIFAFGTKDFSFITFLIPFYVIMLFLSTFSYDEFNHWDTFCNTLPYSKDEIVKSKYILLLISMSGSLLLGIMISYLSTFIDRNIIMEEAIYGVFGSIFGVCLVLSLMIPFVYKFGVQKGKIVLFSISIGLSLILAFIIKISNFNFNNFLSILNKTSAFGGCLFLMVGLIIMIFISYKISKIIYSKKDF